MAGPAPSSTAAAPGPAEGEPVLAVHDLGRNFGGVHAVRDCSFAVAPGSITSLIGPNGAGKTTAFNLIGGLLRPSAGRVTFEGREITAQRPHRITRAGIARTFQITRVLGDLTVLENVVLCSPARGLRRLLGGSMLERERARGFELLEFFGLAKLAENPASELSYGQRKLVELAGALMSEPRLMMLDEPAGGVNPRLIDDIAERIRELNRGGITFLIVEHNMDVVMGLSDSVIVMAHGEVLRQGSPEDVQSDAAVLDAYLGRA
ncbi:MAG: ABC-type branched-chain amino acid transport system, ATPase component [Solirubrobacterales bacterium]|jgi:branched-chain amino acid transport system ATP-binding protein|nr:ABC-type branched-chain amino acid transport system, ATPase component [Solirubrobacterales bacterium]